MKKHLLLLIISMVFSFFSAEAQEVSETKKLKFSFSERIRITGFDNAITLNNEAEGWTFTRFRTNLGLTYRPGKNIELKFQLANESRLWFAPGTKNNRFDEIFVNQLYFKWGQIAKIPLELTIGRQNIMLDEGFICLDGQPLPGSRSAYFNAVKGVYTFNAKNNVTAFVSYIPKIDDLLPVFNEYKSGQLLEEQANTGLGLYYKSQLKKSKLSTYFFRKVTHQNSSAPIEYKTNAIGARLTLPLAKNLSVTAEAAQQFGKSGDEDQSAFGGYFHLDYKIKDEIPVADGLSFGGFYLSGDDPATEKDEGWNPLWSRWPKWSESFIYTLIIENQGKVAYWSNIASLNFSVNGTLSDKVTFKTSYFHLMAVEENLSDFCGGDGKSRGELLTLKLNYKIDKAWSGHFLWENFSPGNFYASNADGYNWLRFELLYRF